ncbi:MULTISPECIES: dihydrolipoamide acetyltransferase family protein [Haloferax]|uniref:Dihydrolipoyllysine-residue acetyltransferase component of pyruvate dehydrogenase complex n=1 Tax=Haloferax massiliensis TaxID=1476858 RepID=A0A0D6JMK4_9EURY|nr:MULTISPECIES: dihydrolipoamide acetyltransferase family protein [Haloferax]MDS0243436.1 2-oxo acid dehydrogenase subunit E2 [Haloferax sp. S2CR25]MDS0446557.1 2-oxo acid dehydrogenase subunit E2 [Haloferax sp. S2CR25-2]CQR49109.1 Dihydrolipoyllysine-residue acetyltransferase component of pyruvate dehydrogenase complex [Haloferax massiliensis]
MALKEFKLPDVGEGVAEGELVTWHVAPGDEVTEDQVLAEVETDKALVDVPSPFNGTVEELLAEEGEVVPVGDVIITIRVGGDEEEAADAAGSDAEAADVDAEPTDSETAESDDAGAGEDDGSSSGGRVFAPPSVRRLARELGVSLESVDGSGPSGRVTEGDVRAAAEDAGDEGGDEPSGPRTVQTNGKSATAKRDEGTSGSATASAESADRGQTLAAPATRALAKEEGVDIDAVPATEMRDGEAFVSPEAVKEYAQAQREAQAADAEAVAAEADAVPATAEATGEATSESAPPEAGPGAGERVPYKGVRKAIGDQMQRSKYTAPHVTHHDEVDVTELVELREQLKPVAEERGSRLTYMPFVMKAVVAALKDFPYLNSQLDEENEEIVLRDEYNIGVAAATDAGLLVPVVRDADRKGMLELADEMNEKVEKARNRKIAPEEMRGGTFTITNIGGIGGEYATPIVNYPEVAILALGAIKDKPRVVDGEVVPRKVLTLSLSFDHRIVDGAQGARFTNRVKELLEDPKLLVLE